MRETEALFDFNTVYSQRGLPEPAFFNILTSGTRMAPDFFIIGAQKAGTNSLANYLSAQKGIIPPWHKEISFFNNDIRFAKGVSWYHSFFSTKFVQSFRQLKQGCKQITFDASANYFEETKSAQRIKTFNPSARIIVLLRDPAMRAWSHYKMARDYGFENKNFTEALELENKRIASNTHAHNFAYQRLAYRSKGEYINYLSLWQNTFGNNILIVFYEELFANKNEELQKIHDFLKLNTIAEPEKLIHINKGKPHVIPNENLIRLREHYSGFDTKLSELLNRKLPWENNKNE